MTAPGWFRVSTRSVLLLARRLSNAQVLTGEGRIRRRSAGRVGPSQSPLFVSGRIAMVSNERRAMLGVRFSFSQKREGNRWIAIHQSEGAVMQTKRGRLTAVRGILPIDRKSVV